MTSIYPCPRCASLDTKVLRRTPKANIVILACDGCGEVNRLKSWYQTIYDSDNANKARRLMAKLEVEA